MVRTKKVTKKVPRDAPEITPTFVEPEAMPESFKPNIVVATADYKALLKESPEVPHIGKIEHAVKFVDEYAKWKHKVQAATT